MGQRLRRMIIPGWWWECWQQVGGHEAHDAPALAPSMDADELHFFVFLLNDLRDLVLSGERQWKLSVAEAQKICPGVKKLQQKVERVVQMLGGLRTLLPDGSAKLFFSQESWNFSSDGAEVCLEITDQMIPWVLGYELYASKPHFSWTSQTFSVASSAMSDFVGRDLDLYLRMEKAMQSGEHRVHADDVHGIAVCPQDWITWSGRHRLGMFMRRLKDHGVVTHLGDSPVNAYEAGSFVYWKDAHPLQREAFVADYLKNVGKAFLKSFLRDDARLDKIPQYYDAMALHGYVIPLGWLFFEWKSRLKSSDCALPVALKSTPGGQMLLEPEVDLEAFSEEVKQNIAYHFWIDIDLDSSAKFLGERAPISHKRENSVELKNKKPLLSSPRSDVAAILPAKTDLSNMKRVQPSSYNHLKRKFFDSLNRTEKEALLNGSQKMDEVEFEEYLQRLLSVFVTKNPQFGPESTQTH